MVAHIVDHDDLRCHASEGPRRSDAALARPRVKGLRLFADVGWLVAALAARDKQERPERRRRARHPPTGEAGGTALNLLSFCVDHV